MSKYKAYGKSRASSRAGLQFDKLIKACSNSKKPPIPSAAGAIGRFGVAQFTSTRSCLDSQGEDYVEPSEKQSRFSSLNKRPRMAPDLAPPPTIPHLDPFIAAHYPLSSASSSGGGPPLLYPQQQQTILKPRKFFKSRGPMEVEVDPSTPPRPYYPRSDISAHLNNSSPYPPILSSISLNKGSGGGISDTAPPLLPPSASYKSPPKKNKRKHSSPSPSPPPLQNFSSPPIKLKIIKDKGKFVSVSEDSPTKKKKAGRPPRSDKKVVVKEPKGKIVPGTTKPGRGRPPKNRDAVAKPIVYKEPETPPTPPPQPVIVIPNPKRSSSRVTRSSARYGSGGGGGDEGTVTNQNVEPTQESYSRRHYEEQEDADAEASSRAHGNHHGGEDTLKKLEEDAEFQKLSQMLSSMEDEGQDQQQQQPPPQQETYANSSSSSYGGSNTTYFAPPPLTTPPLPPPKKSDIRSILEDDWNESYEEESPRKSGSTNLGQISPPKVSRFDPSAFMPEEEELQGQVQHQHHHRHPRHRHLHQHIENQDQDDNGGHSQGYDVSSSSAMEAPLRPIPLYPPAAASGNGTNFNINSSPYAMKNLLGGGGDANDFAVDMSTSQKSEEATTSSVSSNSQQYFDSQSSSQNFEEMMNLSPSKKAVAVPPVAVAPSVAPPPPKKASIFKSRAKADKPPTKNAVYKHTFGQVDKPEGSEESKTAAHNPPGTTLFEDFFDDGGDVSGESNLTLRKVRLSSSQPRDGSQGNDDVDSDGDGDSKVLCHRGAKKLFTVVRNVKAGHELQESGEFHEFDGDVMYILEDLKDKHPINSRCLSAITLAGRCMDQAFRMHLRAHGTVTEFCRELHDSPSHPVLSLLAATVLFVLSQDRLNMDLDTESLKLILALTKSDFGPGGGDDGGENVENAKNRQRVIQLCSEMKARGHAKHLNLEKITASELALETLLYLTSKRAGEWVKHELRTLGGLDSIVGEVESCFNSVVEEISAEKWDEVVNERLRKIDRCLEVLGRVTFNHEDNQRYLMQVSTRHVEGGLPVKCTPASPTVFLEMFRFCREFLMRSNQSMASIEQVVMIREILFLLLRLLVNLSHDYRGIVLGSEIMMDVPGFLELCLHSIFEMTKHFPDEKVFDLLMHSLCLLLNLVETSRKNRSRILQATLAMSSHSTPFSISTTSCLTDSADYVPLLDALIEMFLQRERSAKTEEQHTDNILTTGEKETKKRTEPKSQSSNSDSQEDKDGGGGSVQDTIDQLISTAGKHMENSLIAAYISLLIGFLVMDDLPYVEKVRDAMPNRALLPLMVVLKKLFNFMSITSSASGSTRGLKATAIALKFYAKVDTASAEELKKIIPE